MLFNIVPTLLEIVLVAAILFAAFRPGYVAVILFAVIAYVLFSEVPTPVMLAGAALIVAAGIFIIWRERQLGLNRDRQRKVSTPQG